MKYKSTPSLIELLTSIIVSCSFLSSQRGGPHRVWLPLPAAPYGAVWTVRGLAQAWHAPPETSHQLPALLQPLRPHAGLLLSPHERRGAQEQSPTGLGAEVQGDQEARLKRTGENDTKELLQWPWITYCSYLKNRPMIKIFFFTIPKRRQKISTMTIDIVQVGRTGQLFFLKQEQTCNFDSMRILGLKFSFPHIKMKWILQRRKRNKEDLISDLKAMKWLARNHSNLLSLTSWLSLFMFHNGRQK